MLTCQPLDGDRDWDDYLDTLHPWSLCLEDLGHGVLGTANHWECSARWSPQLRSAGGHSLWCALLGGVYMS
jgi:hypothetical protein